MRIEFGIIEQLVRRAGEFGICEHLGANIFNYFVVTELKDIDFWLCKLLDEMLGCSRLQYIFEYAIGIGISEYKRNNELGLGLNLETSRRRVDRLLRKDTGLYRLLKLPAESDTDR